MTKSKVTLLNMIMALVQQICTIISGFIIPRIILMYFGSETNGLISSLVQFLNYIALVEGGITSVVTARLYKPLVNGDYNSVSSILVTARNFYRKISVIFIGYSIILSIVFPLLKHTEFSFIYVFSLSMVLSVGIFIQYMFSLTLKTVLDADKKSYIVTSTQSLIIVLNVALGIISVNIFPSAHLLKGITALLFIIQPIVYGRYVKAHYPINWLASANNELIKERWNGFAINTAAFIHNCTDIAVLTVFTDLKTVSIYSVYALVTNGLKQLINSLFTGITPVIGQSYAKEDTEELNTKLDVYEYICFILVFLAFTLSSLLITPFVLLYTKNINDANYNQDIFGVLISVSEAIYLIKMPHLTLSYTANKFREISIHAYIEAGINIVISIILVKSLGLIGVALGTIAGMLYRMIFHVWFTSRIVEKRSQFIFYKKLILFLLTTSVGVLICRAITIEIEGIISWILCGVLYFIVLFVLYLVISLLAFRDEMKYILHYLKKEK